MDKPFPKVSVDTTIERLSSIITKENPAVIAYDESGKMHIVTKYDIIGALGR
jgi:cystathionine beta-synthase